MTIGGHMLWFMIWYFRSLRQVAQSQRDFFLDARLIMIAYFSSGVVLREFVSCAWVCVSWNKLEVRNCCQCFSFVPIQPPRHALFNCPLFSTEFLSCFRRLCLLPFGSGSVNVSSYMHLPTLGRLPVVSCVVSVGPIRRSVVIRSDNFATIAFSRTMRSPHFIALLLQVYLYMPLWS